MLCIGTEIEIEIEIEIGRSKNGDNAKNIGDERAMKKSKNRSVVFLKDLAPRADVQGGAAKRVFGAPSAADAGGSHEAPTAAARAASPRPSGARGRKKPSK